MASETDRHLDDWQRGDIDTLERLFSAHDPHSLNQMIAEDAYEEVVVEKAQRDGERTVISWDDGITTSLKGPKIEVGDRVRFYGGAKLGDMHHGWALNGVVVEWRTPWERYAERIEMLAQHDRSRREHLDQARDDIDAWYGDLTGPYKARIDRMRSKQPDFDVECGSYEIYPVLMAQRIERWARGETETWEGDLASEAASYIIAKFRELPYEEQAKTIHGGKEDKYGISGWQFDAACGLAASVLAGKEI